MSEDVVDDGFDAMVVWLCDNLGYLCDGDLWEVGPVDGIDAEGPLDCAEVWRCGDRWLVRLSRVALFEVPDDEDALPLDTWVADPEGTDGRLLTGNREVVAEALVCWFRDRLGVPSTGALAFTHSANADMT